VERMKPAATGFRGVWLKLRAPFALALLLSSPLSAQPQSSSRGTLADISLEELMDIKVTSVSKREQNLSRAAAAVFVINQEDIRRSGAVNIPDLLRMAPGVDVEQIDANAWAIGIRGFNSRFSNKVLVLIDGRTVYDPIFSGVFWDQLEVPLEDIDRIEVIRGPGATIWGANAVNGVINIITKSSKETKGGQVTAGGGSQTQATSQLQYGGTAGRNGTYRVFGNYSNIGNSAAQNGAAANDHWQRMNTGFRSDWEASKSDSLMFQGDLFANQENENRRPGFIATPYDQILPQTVDAAGGDFLARWDHTLAGGSQTSLQAYYDTYRRTDSGVPLKVSTFDLDFHHHIAAGDRQEIVWGLGYRADTSGGSPGYSVAFTPPFRTVSLFNIFLQDEIRISYGLWATIGVKLEHNPYTGFQIEPSVRMVWAPPARRYTVWAAASSAIREPARADADVQSDLQRFPLSANTIEVVRLFGNPRVKAEEIRDYELGYRSDLTKTLSLDVTTFLSFYRHLETIEPQAPVIIPGSPLIIEIPTLYENKARAVDYGGELSLTWKAAARWRISPGYSYLHATVRQDPTSQGQASSAVAADFPQNMFQIRSLLNLSRNIEFDQSLYYTARLPGGAIPGHARLDLRLARRIGESTEISIVGQNLLRPRTLEYGDSVDIVGAQSVRSVYGKITWRF
jgi:iron complex outermembrane receptor protein